MIKMNTPNDNTTGSPNFQNISININNSETSYIDCNILKGLKHFCISHLNIRSLDKNSENLIYLLQDCNFNIDILCLTETWQNLNNCTINGYQPPITLLRSNKKGGGVGIYCKNNINFKNITEMSRSNEYIEIISIEYKTNKVKGIISSVYRPPSQINQHIQSIMIKYIFCIGHSIQVHHIICLRLSLTKSSQTILNHSRKFKIINLSFIKNNAFIKEQ